MKKSLLNLVAVCGFSLLAVDVYAEQGSKGMDMAGMKMDGMPAKTTNTTVLADGEVKAINKESNNITLKHGRIKSTTVEMGPMTMSFPVKDKALLSNVKAGDKVKFTVENVNGEAIVTVLLVQK
ncbi:copper transporter [Herminiimonas sp. KBW02]|uniref:Copper-binding protein n=1 Tax=Herminiimonas glaciei TaxID=523788 RepID=A0ABW2I911_9BURK|nr:copper-binding protein [Herminiimonas sp. KBW02]RQO36454.1 copper transporter [Herminiimonas sp. KBW02]